jgi:D-3-phosphoglycerate dehydrogenase
VSRQAVRIVATDPVPKRARALFASLGEIEVNGTPHGPGLAEAEILLVRGTRVDAGTIASAPCLRVIARTGSGYDGVDLAAATARGIPVLYAPEAGTVPVAEGAFALILAAAKRMRELGEVLRLGDWGGRYDIETADLRGATLGIVGFGRIGQEVGRIGAAFGMHVLAHDPFAGDGPVAAELVPLDELVRRADVITLHCALTPSTRGMIDRRLLAITKPGAILVNVARGAIVESDGALLEALETGRLSAVALDVFADEPPDPGHPLFAHPRVICTPHSVGLTARWNESVFGTLAETIESVLAGGRPANVLNPEALERPVERSPR